MDILRDSIAEKLGEWTKAYENDKRNYSPEELSTRQYQNNRLKELKKIFLQFYAVKDNRNSVALKTLKIKVDFLERSLYKSFTKRLWEKIKDTIRFRGYLKEIKAEHEQNYQQVKSFVNQTNLAHEYGPQVTSGAKEILIPNRQYHQMSRSEIMNYDYKLTRSIDGFNTTSYHIRILSTHDTSNVKEVRFKLKSLQWLNKDQLYNLATGKTVMHTDRHGNENWLKLNHLDKDHDGNSTLIELSSSKLDLKAELQRSALNNLDEESKSELIRKIKDGSIVNVTAVIEGKEKIFTVKADFFGRSLAITERLAAGTIQKIEKENHPLSVSYKSSMVKIKHPSKTKEIQNRPNRKTRMKVIKGGP